MKPIQEQFKKALRSRAGLSEGGYSHHGVEDIATEITEELMNDGSLSNVGISLEGLNSQQQRALEDALVNALMSVGEKYNMVF